jgi:hypothetical protein
MPKQIKSNLVRPGVRVGSASAGINPGWVAQLGQMQGDHSTEHGRVTGAIEPVGTVARPSQVLGNAKALDVGGGCPGTGRRVMGSGSQGTHGAVAPGNPPPKRDLFPGFGGRR